MQSSCAPAARCLRASTTANDRFLPPQRRSPKHLGDPSRAMPLPIPLNQGTIIPATDRARDDTQLRWSGVLGKPSQRCEGKRTPSPQRPPLLLFVTRYRRTRRDLSDRRQCRRCPAIQADTARSSVAARWLRRGSGSRYRFVVCARAANDHTHDREPHAREVKSWSRMYDVPLRSPRRPPGAPTRRWKAGAPGDGTGRNRFDADCRKILVRRQRAGWTAADAIGLLDAALCVLR